MSEKTNFDNKKINKSNFYITKRLFKIDDINIDKILISKKEPYGKKGLFNGISVKYFIAYEDRNYIGPLCIKDFELSALLSALAIIKPCHLKLLIIIY